MGKTATADPELKARAVMKERDQFYGVLNVTWNTIMACGDFAPEKDSLTKEEFCRCVRAVYPGERELEESELEAQVMCFTDIDLDNMTKLCEVLGLEKDLYEPGTLFDLLDVREAGRGDLAKDEFFQAASRLRGDAKAIEIHEVM